MIYSFDLTDFEAGRFTATRYPDGCAVSGDWCCSAESDAAAIELAGAAASTEWLAPEGRHHRDFSVSFVDSLAMGAGEVSS